MIESTPIVAQPLPDRLPAASLSGCHLSWPAIFAGLVAAMALEVLFVMLGAALGFAIFSPLTDPHPGANFGAGAAVVEGLSAVVSLWFGGWVAGRLSPIGVQTTGWLHGFVVWCAATVVGVALVTSGAGTVFSGLSKLVGGGLSMAGKPMAAAAGRATDAAKEGLQRSQATVSSFVDEAAATPAPNANAGPGAGIRTRRDVSLALGRLFDPAQKANLADNKAAAAKVLVDDTGMSQADADKDINDWTASYDRLQGELTDAKNQAEAKARVEADEASKDLAIFSGCAFVAFLIGAAAATAGATHGVRCARRHDVAVTIT